MRTRARDEGDGKAEVDKAAASLTLTSPRSSKKRKAPTTTASDVATKTTAQATKKATTQQPRAEEKPKDLTTATVTSPVPGGSSSKVQKPERANLEKPKKIARSEESKAVGGQSVPLTNSNSTTNGIGGPITSAVTLVGSVALVAPKGRSVSGRDWKVRKQSQRASMQVTTATQTLSTTWAKKLEIKAKRQAITTMEKEMKDAKRQEIEDKKQEKIDREKRRQQNEMKNTTYQTISKTHKMKTMSKKQLRQIKKRQVNARTGEIEFVSPWGGGKKK